MANYTLVPYSIDVVFIEAPIFLKLVYDYLNEDEYAALQWTLAARPETGKDLRLPMKRVGGPLGPRSNLRAKSTRTTTCFRKPFLYFRVRFGGVSGFSVMALGVSLCLSMALSL